MSSRREAGKRLAEQLSDLTGQDCIVLAIPRGGVVVAYEVALALGAPMAVFITRKLGAPGNPELAIGAVASDGTVITDDGIARLVGATEEYVAAEKARQMAEIRRRMAAYGSHSPQTDLAGRVAVLIDDGIATGATVRAALVALRKQQPRLLVLAVPVAPPDIFEELSTLADRSVVLATPEPFWAVGQFYRKWVQVSDEEVVDLLARVNGSR